MPAALSQHATPKASRYLQQLCKHFAHKVEVDYSETEGTAALPGGRLALRATEDALHVRIEGESARDLCKARYVLEDHLIRFAFRDGLMGLDWRYEAE